MTKLFFFLLQLFKYIYDNFLYALDTVTKMRVNNISKGLEQS